MFFKKHLKSVPITLLTGYLGAGKTTLLNNILRNPAGHKIAVIVNDIGEVNIDAELIAKGGAIEKPDENLVPLQNGCICCTLKTDLMEQIVSLITKGKFDYIVIEASGICEPIPIAQTITAMTEMAKTGQIPVACHLDNIASVVDALRIAKEFNCGEGFEEFAASEEDEHHHHDHDHDHDEHEEHHHEEHHDDDDDEEDEDIASLLVQQIEFCNTIILNKVDEVSEGEKKQIRTIIKALAPDVKIIETNFCNVDINELIDTNSFDIEEVYSSAGWIKALTHDHHHKDPTALEYGINTFVYTSRKPFVKEKLDDAFKLLHKKVIRTKGFIWFDAEPSYMYIFEQCGPQVTIQQNGMWAAALPEDQKKEVFANYPDVLENWDEKYGDRLNRVVFIGQGIDEEKISKMMDECLGDI